MAVKARRGYKERLSVDILHWLVTAAAPLRSAFTASKHLAIRACKNASSKYKINDTEVKNTKNCFKLPLIQKGMINTP